MVSDSFWVGFEKRALDGEAVLAGLAMLDSAAGFGALAGHGTHVQKKLMHAREGKDYKPKSFIDNNPKLTGAASLGLAPAYSALFAQKKLDRDNPKTRKVMDEHPFMTAGLG